MGDCLSDEPGSASILKVVPFELGFSAKRPVTVLSITVTQ